MAAKKRELIRVVTGGRGRPAVVQEIEPTLDEFQRLVEGSIEYISDGAGVGAYVNEDGRMQFVAETPIVFMGIALVGPILVFGGLRSGNERSLTPEQAHEIKLNLARWS